jgi:hypothetical protein
MLIRKKGGEDHENLPNPKFAHQAANLELVQPLKVAWKYPSRLE